jgi:hypothetical protein
MEVLNLLKQFSDEHKRFIGIFYNFNDAVSDVKYLEGIVKLKFFNSETFEIDGLFTSDLSNYKHLSNDKQLLREIRNELNSLIVRYDAYFIFKHMISQNN